MAITVELKHPIQAHGETVSVLTMRRPTFGDLMQMDAVKGEMAKTAKLVEVCAQIPASSVRSIDVEDLGAITEAIAPFFGSLKIGESAESD